MSPSSRPSHSTENIASFRTAFARHFAPNVATLPGSAADPIELDLDGPPPRGSRSRVSIILSSDDEDPVKPRQRLATRKRLLGLTSKTSSSSGKASGSSDPKSKPQGPPLSAQAPSVQSTPPQLSNAAGAFKHSPGPRMKTSPQSFGKSNNAVLQSFGAEAEDSSAFEPTSHDEDDEPRRGSSRTSLKQVTPTRSSPRGSQPATINSLSPLLSRMARLRAERKINPPRLATSQEHSQEAETSQSHTSNGEASEEAKPAMSKLEGALVGFYTTMQDDHAATVRWLLHDARTAIEDQKPLFIDKVSPFAYMEPVHVTPGVSIPEGSSILKIDFYYNKKNRSKSRVEVISSSITDLSPRVPIYYSYTAVKRNILSANEEKLRFTPYLGDAADSDSKKNKATFRKFISEVEHMYSLKKPESGRRHERLAQIRSYLNHWLNELNLGIGRKELITYFLKNDNDDIGLQSWQVKALLTTFEVRLSQDDGKVCQKLCEAFEAIFQYSLKDVILLDEQLKELGELPLKKSNNETPVKDVKMLGTDQHTMEHNPDRLGTYCSLLCLICGAVCCQTHGDYQRSTRHDSDSDTSEDEWGNVEYSYNFQPVIMRYDDLLRKQDVREAEKEPDFDLGDSEGPLCSDRCYRNIGHPGIEHELSPEKEAQIRSMAISLRGSKNRPCDISFILGLDCLQVQDEIRMSEPRLVEINPPGDDRPKGPSWYDNKRKTLKDNWREVTKAHQHEERAQANPCAHDGPCLDSCPCHSLNVLCESFCGCYDNCTRKWTGCSCHATGILCTSDACICIQMNRECGPQCVSCGAISRIDPTKKYYDELFQTGCQNVSLQRGVPRKSVLGESQLAGFGLYVAEPVRKGQFLMEYAGEVISNDEAERRGVIYDRKFLSFLFDLNNECVVDAARMGNNSRFINHADNERDGLNCEAKIVLVNGEHRIKFVALRDLEVGEELLFNYGKKFAEKHGLSKKLPKAREGRGGVLVGEEALAALDGLTPASRVKMTAIRGARSRKARKTAQVREVVAERAVESEEMQEDGDDSEEDEVEEEIASMIRRRKRKITRPARYTR